MAIGSSVVTPTVRPSFADGELAAAAQEVRRRLFDAVRPFPKPRHGLASEEIRDALLLQVPDRQPLVIVLAAEHRLGRRRDVEVLERTGAHELASPQLLLGGRFRDERAAGRAAADPERPDVPAE